MVTSATRSYERLQGSKTPPCKNMTIPILFVQSSSSYRLSNPVAIEAKKEVEGDTYSYDGTVYKINGERRLGIDNVLVTLFNMKKKEMRRHALFWDVISPADLGNEELWVQIKMLKAGLAKLKDGGVAEDLASSIFPYFPSDLVVLVVFL